MSRSFVRTVLSSLALVLMLSNLCEAQIAAYRTKGTGSYKPFEGTYSGKGTGTHLGNHTFNGAVEFTGVAPGGGVYFQSPNYKKPGEVLHVNKAANGDLLRTRLRGIVVQTPVGGGKFTAVWTAEFEIVSGTGRFANAKGKIPVIAKNPPFTPGQTVLPFTWTMKGKINLGKK